jgi:RHS repeat-associated protein
VTSYTYDPFGTTSAFGFASTNLSQYTGRENELNGLYYHRARYYNPAFGRFLSQDPIRFSRGSANLYGYARGNPIQFNDPLGLWTFEIGFSVNYTLPFNITGTLFAGVAVDTHGNVATYDGWGGGLGEGAGASGGVSLGFSNANTVCGLGGPFLNLSGTGGVDGLAGTADYFTGAGNGPGGVVNGGGVTFGVGGGASASAMETVTNVHPFGRKSCP